MIELADGLSTVVVDHFVQTAFVQAWMPGQTMPQPPQLFLLVTMLVSHPLALLLSQSMNPGWQTNPACAVCKKRAAKLF
ncbi:MAG TPA: hypothetical protein VG986_06295 [Pseudolabrys sp.]|nr:hypothetical protein [Pseudolabrys sp.]